MTDRHNHISWFPLPPLGLSLICTNTTYITVYFRLTSRYLWKSLQLFMQPPGYFLQHYLCNKKGSKHSYSSPPVWTSATVNVGHYAKGRLFCLWHWELHPKSIYLAMHEVNVHFGKNIKYTVNTFYFCGAVSYLSLLHDREVGLQRQLE